MEKVNTLLQYIQILLKDNSSSSQNNQDSFTHCTSKWGFLVIFTSRRNVVLDKTFLKVIWPSHFHINETSI